MTLAIHPSFASPPTLPKPSTFQLKAKQIGQFTQLGFIANKVRLITQELSQIISIESTLQYLKSMSSYVLYTSQNALEPSTHWVEAIDLSYMFKSLREKMSWVKESPAYLSLKLAQVTKQTADFGLTLMRWIKGEQPIKTLAKQSINTLISWLPLTYYHPYFAPSSHTLPTVMISLYTLSLIHDAKSIYEGQHEKSPLVEYVQGHLKPYFRTQAKETETSL